MTVILPLHASSFLPGTGRGRGFFGAHSSLGLLAWIDVLGHVSCAAVVAGLRRSVRLPSGQDAGDSEPPFFNSGFPFGVGLLTGNLARGEREGEGGGALSLGLTGLSPLCAIRAALFLALVCGGDTGRCWNHCLAGRRAGRSRHGIDEIFPEKIPRAHVY